MRSHRQVVSSPMGVQIGWPMPSGESSNSASMVMACAFGLVRFRDQCYQY